MLIDFDFNDLLIHHKSFRQSMDKKQLEIRLFQNSILCIYRHLFFRNKVSTFVF